MRLRHLVVGGLALTVVALLLVPAAFASFSWQGRIGQRSWSLTRPGNSLYEINVAWTNAGTDLDILVCTNSSLQACQNDPGAIWAHGFSTETRMERVIFGNYGNGTLYFHVYRASGANTKAVVTISDLCGGLSRPGAELRLLDLGPGTENAVHGKLRVVQ